MRWDFWKKIIEKYQNKSVKITVFLNFYRELNVNRKSLFSITSITFFIGNIFNFKVFTYIYDVFLLLSTTAPHIPAPGAHFFKGALKAHIHISLHESNTLQE